VANLARLDYADVVRPPSNTAINLKKFVSVDYEAFKGDDRKATELFKDSLVYNIGTHILQLAQIIRARPIALFGPRVNPDNLPGADPLTRTVAKHFIRDYPATLWSLDPDKRYDSPWNVCNRFWRPTQPLQRTELRVWAPPLHPEVLVPPYQPKKLDSVDDPNRLYVSDVNYKGGPSYEREIRAR
jgi:hypothetical protein